MTFVSHRFYGAQDMSALQAQYPYATNLGVNNNPSPSQLSDRMFDALARSRALEQVHRPGGQQSEWTHNEWKAAERMGIPVTSVIKSGPGGSAPVSYNKPQYGRPGFDNGTYSKAELQAEILHKRLDDPSLTAHEAYQAVKNERNYQGKPVGGRAFKEWR